MAGFKLIEKAIRGYSAKGATLLRKERNLPLTNLKSEAIKNIKLCDDAVSYDVSRVGKNFDAQNCFEDIITIRNKEGKILQ